ncbi:hypothetical protein [Flavobacterium sp. Leaf82]|uniref:hypothetical protein n=2 Tax=unclassified Flavobacterium TaxID=196869 RepID=UPI000A5F7249|nr:hypothetical protein [Flavobacterium sp. Leaf82]
MQKKNMEANSIKTLEDLRILNARYFNNVNSSVDKTGIYTAKIKFLNYFELGCAITDLLKLCILAIDHEAHIISDTNKNAINVALMLETALEMFPLDEFELLSELNEILIADSQNIKE